MMITQPRNPPQAPRAQRESTNLDRKIYAAYRRLVTARGTANQQAAWEQMMALKRMRPIEQIAAMERERLNKVLGSADLDGAVSSGSETRG